MASGGGISGTEAPEILCDTGNGDFQFVRRYVVIGGVAGVTDYELDGVTPYVVVGPVALCPSPAPTIAAEYPEDSPHISGDIGSFSLAVRNDNEAVLTDADLDYSPFAVTDAGAVYVQAAGGGLNVTTGSQYPEDSPHTTADPGNFVLAVRNDTDAVLTDADLDYSPFATDDAGALKVVSGQTALNVNLTGTGVTINSNSLPPGIPGTLVADSAWHSTGTLTIVLLGGTLTISSPVPAANEHIIVTSWDLGGTLTAALGGGVTLEVLSQIYETATPANIDWQATQGLVLGVGKGGGFDYETNSRVIVGAQGEQLSLSVPISVSVSLVVYANMAGFITEV